MAKLFLATLALSVLIACNNNDKLPDVSGIKIDINTARFEKAFFSIDTLHMPSSLDQLRNKFPEFYPAYMQNVLGVSGTVDTPTVEVSKYFYQNYISLYQAIEKKIGSFARIDKDISQGLKYVKHYYPNYPIPAIVSFIGTIDAPGVMLLDGQIGIGLHQYAGKDFAGYQDTEVKQMYPNYIVRRFEPEYIPANVLKAVVSDIYPDSSQASPFVEQMVEKGKQWWLLDKFLPRMEDSLKTGFTARQINWCEANEGLIWSHITKNEDLFAIDQVTIQTYIGEGPFTQSLSPEESPGNIGQWIGRQIVRKFVEKSSGLSPEQVLKTPAKDIIEVAKYRPK